MIELIPAAGQATRIAPLLFSKELEPVHPVILPRLAMVLVTLTLAFSVPRSPWAQANLENPAPGSSQSGIGIVSGWKCTGDILTFTIDNGPPAQLAYGTSRLDTQSVCSDSNNGFAFLINWNLVGNGQHTLRAFDNGVQFASSTFTVITFGTEFLKGANGIFTLQHFPQMGKNISIQWQESLQNFVIAGLGSASTSLVPGLYAAASPRDAVLENPQSGSFQSGIGVVSGWVCNASRVDIVFDNAAAVQAAYGTSREDTSGVCGTANIGFGLLVNWNLLGDGTHTVRALADGSEFASATFTVVTLGTEFLRGANGSYRLEDFPQAGDSIIVRWQESSQNFVVAEKCPPLQICGIMGPLRVHSSNPRYFTDGSGRAIYLTGSHTWNSVQDMSTANPLPGGSFDGYVSWLKSYNHNFARLWMVEHAWDADNNSTYDPLPWLRTGPGTALDGKAKFDVTKFDQAYFDRIRNRAIAAGSQGIYVSVMLFDDWSTENAGAWKGHPFHPSNNVNSINGDPNNNGLGLELHTLQDATIIQLEEAYVRHVIDTVNDLDNVMYEIGNETDTVGAKNWQYHMIDFVKQYELSKPKQHPVGTTVGWPVLEVDNAALFASPADWISPNAEGGYRDNPPEANGSKVIITDTDHLWGVGGDDVWVWKSFCRGLNPIYMDPLDSDSTREAARKAMGDTLIYAKRMNLAAMTPQGSLSSTGYALASSGSEYLIYQPSSGRFTVNLAAGQYTYEWFNPSNNVIASTGTISGGSQSFTPPFSGDAVLYLKSVGAT